MAVFFLFFVLYLVVQMRQVRILHTRQSLDKHFFQHILVLNMPKLFAPQLLHSVHHIEHWPSVEVSKWIVKLGQVYLCYSLCQPTLTAPRYSLFKLIWTAFPEERYLLLDNVVYSDNELAKLFTADFVNLCLSNKSSQYAWLYEVIFFVAHFSLSFKASLRSVIAMLFLSICGQSNKASSAEHVLFDRLLTFGCKLNARVSAHICTASFICFSSLISAPPLLCQLVFLLLRL